MTADRRRCIAGGALAALLLHAAIAVWLTWPLATRLATDLPQSIVNADVLYAGWAAAWMTHALATDPFHLGGANIYAPTPHALFYGPAGFGLLPPFAPVFLLTGNPTLALNLASFGSLVLTAVGTHLVAWRWGGSWLAGAIAGATLWTSACFLDRAQLSPAHAALTPLPLLVFAAARAAHSRRALFAVAPLAALLAACDVVNVAPGVFLPLGILAVVRCVRPATRRAGLLLALAMTVALLPLVPIVWGYGAVRAENPRLLAQSVWPPSSVIFRWNDRFSPTALSGPLAVLVGVGAGLHLVQRLRGRAGTASTRWGAAVLWWLSGVALLTWLPMLLPALTGMAYPFRGNMRLGQCAVAGKGIAAGLAFGETSALLHGLGMPWPAAELLLAAVVALAGSRDLPGAPGRPFETFPAPKPGAELAVLRARPGTVLDVPAILTPPRAAAVAMYRSIGHWRPLINGYASYYPEALPQRLDLAARLPDPDALAALRRETGLATIVVRLEGLVNLIAPPWKAAAVAVATGRRKDLRLLVAQPDVMVFGVAP